MRESRWFPVGPAVVHPKSRMFCIPHGGAGASVFNGWQSHVDSDVEVVPVCPPGRERRISEPSCRSIGAAASALRDPLLDRADEEDFVLFGHSLGALVAYELSHALTALGRPPSALVLSGATPPNVPADVVRLHELPDDEFLAQVDALEGTPRELLSEPGFAEVLLPPLRADFEACETYAGPDAVLDVPMVVLGGEDDARVRASSLAAWAELTTAGTDLRVFPGGHFFLFDRLAEVLAWVVARLRARVWT